MKIKTIRLSDGHNPKAPLSSFTDNTMFEAALRYRVEQVTDSVQFKTGQLLERCVVEMLCEAEDWKVTIVKAV